MSKNNVSLKIPEKYISDYIGFGKRMGFIKHWVIRKHPFSVGH
jgi:hypothetical protein